MRAIGVRVVSRLIIVGILFLCLNLIIIQPGLRPCGWVDTFLKYSGCIQKLIHNKDTVSDMIFAPDGLTLATLSVDGPVRLWRVSDGALLHTIEGQRSSIAHNIAFSPDGAILAILFSDRVELRRVEDGGLSSVLQGEVKFKETAFAPDWSMLATGGYGGEIELMYLNSEQITSFRTLKVQRSPVWLSAQEMAFSPDGTILASGDTDDTVRLWRVNDGTLLRALRHEANDIHSMSFAPSGTMVASGGRKIVFLWRVSDGAILHILEGHKGGLLTLPAYIRDTDFSPDSLILASGGVDGTVRLWRVSDGTLLRTIKHGSEVWSVAFSPDGRILASSVLDGPVRLFDIQQWELDQP